MEDGSPRVFWIRSTALPAIITFAAATLIVSATGNAAEIAESSPATTLGREDQGQSSARSVLSTHVQSLMAGFGGFYQRARHGTWSRWEIIQTVTFFAVIPSLWLLKNRLQKEGSAADTIERNGQQRVRDGVGDSNRAANSETGLRPPSDTSQAEPGLLQKHSEFQSFTTSHHGITYPGIRVFYRTHPQAEKLPLKPTPLPLLVFIHGLGGSIAQFHPLLTSLVNLAPCLGIDFPGCGLSSFAPTSWDAYTTDALVELLGTVIEKYRDKDGGQGCVLIGHSMGCSLAASLASKTSRFPSPLTNHTLGLIAICPTAKLPSKSQVRWINTALCMPNFVMDIWRQWDRRGGLESKSLERFVGPRADAETKRLQIKFNEQSKTAVWRRMVGGWLPRYDGTGFSPGGFAGGEVWAGLQTPIYLIAGEDDSLTPPKELEKIKEFLGYGSQSKNEEHPGHSSDDSGPDAASVVTSPGTGITPRSDREQNKVAVEGTRDVTALSADCSSLARSKSDRQPEKALKTTILPSPAAHALLYASATSRTLAGLLSDFMAVHVDPRLSLGWQLQYLSTEGKWDVKNLAKWQAVAPVSRPIGGIFRAMKTLREVDDRHCPDIFVREWKGVISDVIDISHESPVYDPRGLEKGGIDYHKFPTASKIPPTKEEVKVFNELVDRLLGHEPSSPSEGLDNKSTQIGVHCHYGFNRTGFFIVCRLVERQGYSLQDAIDEFAIQRAPGIRHEHFIDTLFVRYCVGLKRTPTL
ncbi:MAG: hypothetical protein M1837_001967 [Sclerophora amabilis]|nr:MAG: hypothetical protein M1837_001967 [Sclerophora amabilis]